MLSAGEIENVAGVSFWDTPAGVALLEKSERRKDVGLIFQDGIVYRGGTALEQQTDLYLAVGACWPNIPLQSTLGYYASALDHTFEVSLLWDKTPLSWGETRGTGVGMKVISDINLENPLILGSFVLRVPFFAKNSEWAMVFEMDMGANISGNFAGVLSTGVDMRLYDLF